MLSGSVLILVLVVVSVGCLSDPHNHVDDGSTDYLSSHMDQEHHIQGFDTASAFHLHDLNGDNVLEPEEVLKLYGVDHETALDRSESVELHDSKASRILKTVMDRVDLNRDGLITKQEFVDVVSREGLPKFDDIAGLGHHYDEEGEYFLHHEEIYHSTPETQAEDAYTHPEDVRHFSHHEEIETKEDELSRIAQGLPEDANSIEYKKQLADRNELEQERSKRLSAVRQQVFKFNQANEVARQRGKWEGFQRPLDRADRLRENVPYKYKLRKSFWGEF